MTSPEAQQEEPGPVTDMPHSADDAPTGSNVRGRFALVLLLLLVALGLPALVKLGLARSGRGGGKTPRSAMLPHSDFRIAAAPRSVVHIVSAPTFGRSHVQMPNDPAARGTASRLSEPELRPDRRPVLVELWRRRPHHRVGVAGQLDHLSR